MSGFILHCACGQDMTVPETAIGRTGLCPACGSEIAISREKLQAVQTPPRPGGGLLSRRNALQVAKNNENREESWRKFAAAVDLYNQRRYAEAMTLLGMLQQEFPGNAEIANAQAQCAEALKEASAPVLTYEGERVEETVLSEELIKGVLLKKMLHGATEEIQLHAAELAARVIGLLPHVAPESPVLLQKAPVAPAPDVGTNGNGETSTPAPRKTSARKPRVEEIP